MAIGLELAIVLRAKGGVNFLMHARGLGAKDVNEATKEALDVLAYFAETGGSGDLAKTGDCSPGFVAGQLTVPRGRLQVTYRLVSAVWVLVVAAAGTNTALCAHITDCSMRLLVAACKGVDVTPDKVARRYPEVYLATGQLLSPGGLSLGAARLLASAEAEVASISPDSGTKTRGPSAVIKSRLGVGGKKVVSSSPSSTSLSQPSPETSQSGARSLSGEAMQPAWAPFALPADAVHAPSPVVLSTLSNRREISHDDAAVSALDDLLGPPLPVPGDESLAGTGLETLEPPLTDYAHRFSNLRPPPPPPHALDEVWAAFSSEGPQQSGSAARARSPVLPPKIVLPPPTSKQQKAISNGNALQLVELWRASFVGWQLEAAGTSGEILGTGTVPRCSATAVFKLSRSKDAQPRSTTTIAKAARGQPALTTSTGGAAMIAHFGEASTPQAPFLRYCLPAVGVQPPVLLAIAVAAGAPQPARRGLDTRSAGGSPSQLEPDDEHAGSAVASTDSAAAAPRSQTAEVPPSISGAQLQLAAPATRPSLQLLTVQLAVSPALQGPLRGVCLDVDVHPALGPLCAASINAQWCHSRRRLRWRLYSVSPGSRLRLRATFQAVQFAPDLPGTSPPVACATLRAFGAVGEGLSGITLHSGSMEASLKDSRQAFYCEVHARTNNVSGLRARVLREAVCCLEAGRGRDSSTIIATGK